jgi:dolichol-phosphate mannosyltransferase
MSGYFAFPRKILDRGLPLSPVGYKIALEILTKTPCRNVIELPIAFIDRQKGASKFTVQEQLLYLRHLRRLYRFRFPRAAEMLQFGAVGSSGLIIDLTWFLSFTHLLGFDHQIARALSFVIAASWNWFFNRWFTFVGGGDRQAGKQWLAFLCSAAFGLGVNWGSYKLLTDNVLYITRHRMFAFLIGIFLGTSVNYTLSRMFIFTPFAKIVTGLDSLDEKRQ